MTARELARTMIVVEQDDRFWRHLSEMLEVDEPRTENEKMTLLMTLKSYPNEESLTYGNFWKVDKYIEQGIEQEVKKDD